MCTGRERRKHDAARVAELSRVQLDKIMWQRWMEMTSRWGEASKDFLSHSKKNLSHTLGQ